MSYGAKTEHDVSINKAWVWPLVIICALSVTTAIVGWVCVTKISTDGEIRKTEIQVLKK